jgi:hypothetical protein
MEPQLNYPSAYEEQPSVGKKVYGRSKLFGCGCFTIIAAILVLILLIAVGYFYLYPSLTPNKLRGDFLNVTLVPSKNGAANLWILTDGSFNFIQTTKSPGHYSTGRKCYFCKTWTYIYEPVTQKIIKKFKTDFEDIIIKPDIFYSAGKVWIIIRPYNENPLTLNVYDPETGELVLDLKGFMNNHSEFSSGITEATVFYEPEPHLRIKTRDGQNDLVYSITEESVYKNYSEYIKAFEEENKHVITVFVLGKESSSSSRMKLFLVTGAKSKISKGSSVEHYLDNPSTLKFFTGATAEKIAPDKTFIEGMIIYQDENVCVVIHQSVADKDSDRLLSCVEKSGRVRWVVPQSELFEKTRVDKDDAFSTLFFMKDKFGGMAAGNLFVFKQEETGVMGFDFQTGKKLWELEF